MNLHPDLAERCLQLADHCKTAAALVSTWPEWKRNVLGEYPKMATETENDMVELQVETAVFIGLQMPKARAAKMTKEDLCGVVQSLLDDLGIYKDMYAGVTIKEIGCKWDEIPPEELDITSITNDDFPLIDSSEY